MDEKKCTNCETVQFPVKEEENVTSWIHRNRKIIFVVACCALSFKLGYGKGKQEALSVIDHSVRELKDAFDISKF